MHDGRTEVHPDPIQDRQKRRRETRRDVRMKAGLREKWDWVVVAVGDSWVSGMTVGRLGFRYLHSIKNLFTLGG